MYLSVVLRPSAEKTQWFALSFAASLAVLETVRSQLSNHLSTSDMPQIGLKWPNDVIIAGGKIAGILLEVDRNNLIVGCGINITPVGEVFPHNIKPAALASVWPAGKVDIPGPNELATIYLENLANWYEQFCQSGFVPIRDAWLANALFLGEHVTVQRGADALSGIFCDLGMDGTMLLLDDSGKTHHISTGDVKLLGS